MKIKRVTQGDGSHYGYRFDCPGCEEPHVIPTKPHERGWDFDGNEAAPTFSPSILVHETPVSPRCHSFVRAGRIEFLSDCTHKLAGLTVELPELASPPPEGEGRSVRDGNFATCPNAKEHRR